MNVELNVALSSPVIFLKDPRTHINRWIVLNLGTITMGTEFVESKHFVNGEETKMGRNL